MTRQPFGPLVKKARLKVGLTSIQLAARIGRRFDSRIRALERTNSPSLLTVAELAAAFGWELEDTGTVELLHAAGIDLATLPVVEHMEAIGMDGEEIMKVQLHRTLMYLQLADLEIKAYLRYQSQIERKKIVSYRMLRVRIQHLIQHVRTLQKEILGELDGD